MSVKKPIIYIVRSLMNFYPIFVKLAGKHEGNPITDEFKIWPDSIIHVSVTCLVHNLTCLLKRIHIKLKG